jgi:hypothetical protein
VKSKQYTFRELVDEEYLPNGDGLTDAFIAIRGVRNVATGEFVMGCGVSIGTLRKAYHGTNIEPSTALKIREWAWSVHRVEVNFTAMIAAPYERRREPYQRRSNSDPITKLTLVNVVATPGGGFLAAIGPDNDITPEDVYSALAQYMRTTKPREAG